MSTNPARHLSSADRGQPHAELIDAGRRLAATGLLRARSGNISVRTPGGLLVTAGGARLGALAAFDLVDVAGLDERPTRATSELGTHAAIYAARPDIHAVVHTHSPYATAWSCVTDRFEMPLEETRYYAMDRTVGVAAYATGGSPELATAAVAALGDGAAVLLERHGAITVGRTLAEAVDIAESLEHQAHVAWLLRAAGEREPVSRPATQ